MSTKPARLPPLTLRALLSLALPAMAFTVLTHGYRAVDHFWIQDVGTSAQAAIGSSVFVLILFSACFELVAAGAAPLVARATGAQDPETRRGILGSAILAACGVAGVLMVVGGLGADHLAAALGLSGDTATLSATYLRTIALTILPLALTPLVDQSFVAMGNTRLPMVLQGVSLSLNIVLTPLLIHTAGLGIQGAALASNGSRLVATSIGLYALVKATGLTRDHLGLGQARRVLRIGAPMSVGTVTYSLVYWALLYVAISPLGPHVNAALGIGFSALEGFTWPAFWGVAMALSSFVGRYLGAGRPDQARAAMKLAFPVLTLLGLGAAAAFYWGGQVLTGLFTHDPQVHAAATEYAMILAFSQVFVAWEALTEGVLAGAGDTRTVFWRSLWPNAMRVPLAWALALPLGFGAAGIWWAINVTTVVKAFWKGHAAWSSRWERLEV